MHLDGVTIALRQRMPWEATDLGIALVRTHARRIFAAWCLVTLPVFVLMNALAWAIDVPWAAMLVMWWLKPVFDRVPLFAISRAVFGKAPTVREIVRAQFSWGWREMLPWLFWRRLHPGRPWILPVDLLEHVTGGKRSERVRVLAKGEAGPRNQLAMIGLEFELVLTFGVILLVLLFVPTQLLPEATTNLFKHLTDRPPEWIEYAFNAIVWFGTSMVEPFVIGAGFGLYLNRRVQLEAWDVEHAFRRIAARLARSAQVLCAMLVLVGCLASHSAYAQDVRACAHCASVAESSGSTDKPAPTTMLALFAENYRHDGDAFVRQAQQAHAGLVKSARDYHWVLRNPAKPDAPESMPDWAQSLLGAIAFIAHYGLWIIAVLVIGFILYHHKIWMSWLNDAVDDSVPSPQETHALAVAAELPTDIPAAVRALWQRGEQRAALALLYQAGVQKLVERLDAPLPPGATEGQCLARSRKIADRRFAVLFARIVGCWQAAAYAHRLPDTDQLENLLSDWTTPATVAA